MNPSERKETIESRRSLSRFGHLGKNYEEKLSKECRPGRHTGLLRWKSYIGLKLVMVVDLRSENLVTFLRDSLEG